MKRLGLICRLACVFLVAAATLPARAETFTGSNVDSRVIVALKADSAAVQQWMPAGWASVPFPSGPLTGANMLAVLIDRAIDLDAEGKPLSPSSLRAAALAGLGKQTDGDAVHLFLFRIYTTAPERDPYGVAMAADIARTTSETGPANGGRTKSDSWTIVPSDGGALEFSMTYTSGARSFGPGEAFPYSAANPGFSRIYRYDQMVDLVMSTAVGKPIGGAFDVTSTVPELAAVFDGAPQTVAIMDVPIYIRKVSLP
jgi:hypothetical protein